MPFRGRKSIVIVPFLVKYNFAVSAGKQRGVKTSGSWTVGLLGRATYNTRDGRYRVNTPGWGWWESSTRAQRRKRRAEQRPAAARTAAPRTGRTSSDPDATAFRRYFAALKKEEGDYRAEARAYGRCPDCGRLLPASRGGQAACPHCIREAQRAWEKAEAAAEDAARVQREAGSPVKPRRPPASPRPPAAPAPSSGDGWPDVEERVAQSNEAAGRSRQERQEALQAAGLCGHPTQKDRSPCLNHAGSCPHHSGARL